MSEKLLTFCQKNFNSSDKIWFYVSKRTFWIRKSRLGNQSVLETCSYFERKKFNFFPEKNRRFCQNCFFNFRRNFSKKNTFPGKNVFFFIFFGHWLKNFWPFSKRTSRRLPKPQFTCLWDQCRKTKFFERNMVFLSHFDFEPKSVDFLSSSFLRVLQSCIFYFHKNNSKKNRFC